MNLQIIAVIGSIMAVVGAGTTARCDEGQGKFYGKIFADWYYDVSDNDDITRKSEFELSRVYFGYNYKIDERFLVDVLLDVQRAEPVKGVTAAFDTSKKAVSVKLSTDERYYAFLKTAYFAWNNIFPHATLSVGQIGCYAYKIQEKVWGHRYLYSTLMDKAGWESSADLGASLNFTPVTMLSINAGVFNGEGYKAAQDTYGNYRPALGVQIDPVTNFIIYLYGDWMPVGTSSDTAQATIAAFAGYVLKDLFQVGVEYDVQVQQKGVEDHDVSGLSIYAMYNISKTLEIFGRFDQLSSKDDWNTKQDGQTIIGGFQYAPVPKVKIALNYQHSLLTASGAKASDRIYLNGEFNY